MPVLDGKPCYRRTVLKKERLYFHRLFSKVFEPFGCQTNSEGVSDQKHAIVSQLSMQDYFEVTISIKSRASGSSWKMGGQLTFLPQTQSIFD